MTASLLIVEDEEVLQELLAYNLKAEGFAVRAAASGEEAMTSVAEEDPDLILLDWLLPGISGIDLCRMLRAKPETRSIPIILLTARGEEFDRVRGLGTGADDYVVKPFSLPELIERVKTVLRRTKPSAIADRLTAGEITLDRRTRRVSRGGRDVEVSPTEFRLLEHLMSSPGRVYSRAQLLDAVWGRDAFIDERTVDVHIGRLRQTIRSGRGPDPIRTVRGMGYAFDERFR